MTKIKVADATGPVLDWMVTKALGITEIGQPDGVSFEEEWSVMHGSGDFSFCTDWSQGGPIIEREGITVTNTTWMGAGGAYAWSGYLPVSESKECEEHGPTPLIAAMRCFVASKLGEEVEVPEELLS